MTIRVSDTYIMDIIIQASFGMKTVNTYVIISYQVAHLASRYSYACTCLSLQVDS